MADAPLLRPPPRRPSTRPRVGLSQNRSSASADKAKQSLKNAG